MASSIGHSTDAPLPPWSTLREVPASMQQTLGPVSALFLEGYRAMGPAYRFRRGDQEFTVLSGVEANQFMARHGRRYLHATLYRADQNEELGIGKTLVSMDGQEHLRLRRMQKRGYSIGAIADKYPQLKATILRVVDQWGIGQRILLKQAMPRIIGEQLAVGVLDYPLGDRLEDMLIFVRTLVTETVARTRPRSVIRMPIYQRAKQRCFELADEIIEDRCGNERVRPRLADDLMTGLGRYDGLMTHQELRVGVLGGYIGGLDTVASTCCFLIYTLLSNPEVLGRVLAEVDTCFGHGVPTPECVRRMPDLRGAMLETLSALPRGARRPRHSGATLFEFSGYRVDRGSNLIVATTVPHHLPEYFADPGRFDVDRYRPPRNEHRTPGALAPFGTGAHVCLGAAMAEAFIMITVASILANVTLELDPPDYRLEIETLPTPVPKNLWIKVVSRRT